MREQLRTAAHDRAIEIGAKEQPLQSADMIHVRMGQITARRQRLIDVSR